MKLSAFFLKAMPVVGKAYAFVNIPEPAEGGIDWQSLAIVGPVVIAVAIGFLIASLRKSFWEKLKKFFGKKRDRK